ncbi:hypothetical protein D3C77_697970 [compost metagenome]
MAGLFSKHRQQEQFQVARSEDPWAAVATLAAVPTLLTVMAVAVVTVGVMVTHGNLRFR